MPERAMWCLDRRQVLAAVLTCRVWMAPNGFVINGIDELDRSGLSVSSAGDINGDGLDDPDYWGNRCRPQR